MEGRLPETVLKGGAGSGVLRPRLVTAGSGGPGHRPPGMTTWLRGARCTDPEAMPEMEARPPAENRHGGAPRGERPASWDAPRLTSAEVAPRKRDKQNKCACRRSARPSLGRVRRDKDQPGRRHAPRERRRLRCLTSLVETMANGSFACRGIPRLCPGRAQRPRGDTTDRSQQPYCASRVVALGPGSRSVRLRLSALGRDTRARVYPHSSLAKASCEEDGPAGQAP
jgi:hypothetical protein